MLETILPFAISLLIGLLIGIERERSHPEGLQFIGVRTFTLFSIFGTLIATINQLPITLAASTFVFGIILLNYFRSTATLEPRVNFGIVTEISAAIIFCLGYMVPSSPLIAIIVSAVILLVLIERKRLHTLARKKFKPQEIEAGIILTVFALGIIPILPNQAIDPWHLFNPRNFGILIATIAAIQFVGYISIQLFGERFGLALNGFLSGLISSTAFFAILSDTIRNHPHSIPSIIASAILATLAMLLDIMLIVFVASPTLLIYIIWPMVAMFATGTIFSVILLHFQNNKKHIQVTSSSPLNLISIIRTSIFIGLILIIIAIAQRYTGTNGVLLVAFFGGLVEIHGITLATALLYLGNEIKISDASLVIYIAILASFISKFILLGCLTPYRFAIQTSLFLFAISVSGSVIYLIYPGFN